LPLAAGEPPKRLVGWSKVRLNPGESQQVEIQIDRKYLSIFNADKRGWELLPGDYVFSVGVSSRDLPLKESVTLK
jgi:beta-glucosidase